MGKPYLIVVTGRPGAGKTTFAKELSHQLALPIISRDELKEGYVHTFGVSHHQLPNDSNKYVTELFFETINHLVDANISLIVEAAFQHHVWEHFLTQFISKTKLTVLICKPDTNQIAMQRYVTRGLTNPLREYFHGDNGIDDVRKGLPLKESPYIEPKLNVPTIYINTTDSYSPSIADLKHQIFENFYLND